MNAVRDTEFTWKIESFILRLLSTGEAIESPVFSVDANKATKFKLLIYFPNRSRRNLPSNCQNFNDHEMREKYLLYRKERMAKYYSRCEKSYLYCEKYQYGDHFIQQFKADRFVSLKRLDDDGQDKISLNFEIIVTNSHDDQVQKSHKLAISLRKNESYNSYLKYIEIRNLMPSDILTVKCRIFGQYQKEDLYTDVLENYTALSNDFGQLLESGNHSDMTIVVDGKEFSVHSVILHCRCPNLVKELVKINNSTTYSLPSIEASTLQTILKYVYTGTYCYDEDLEGKLAIENNAVLSDLKKKFLPFSGQITAINIPNIFLTELQRRVQRANEYPASFQLRSEVTLTSRISLVNHCLRASKYSVTCNDWIPFQAHFQGLYVAMKDPDLCLCLGGINLPAHRAILSSRSEVFSKMFEYDTKEKQTGTVNIEDVDLFTMMSLLRYMYCGDTTMLDMANVFRIYTVADKYLILNLREKCSRYLQTHMSIENIGTVLILSYDHYDQELNNAVHTFIERNIDELHNAKEGLKAVWRRMDVFATLSDKVRLVFYDLKI